MESVKAKVPQQYGVFLPIPDPDNKLFVELRIEEEKRKTNLQLWAEQ